jgi:hypothetical protein
MSLVAASTSHGPLLVRRSGELQEFRERRGAGLMQGRPHRQLDGFQIETTGLAAAAEDDAQELVYFARDLALDRFGRFFSCGVCSVCSMGRKRQIFRLTPINSVVRA